jgi:predicted ATPase
VQSGLADVILSVARTRKLQVVVESHSEHMLRRLQRRVAEEAYPSDQLKLYFCDSVGGEATLQELMLNVFGEIGNWPNNFFGDEMTEIAETRKAALKRKIAAQAS